MSDYSDCEFVTITQLGDMFGVSRVVMGRWLARIGLRNRTLDPTQDARNNGFCKLYRNDREIVFWVWHRNKTIKALKAAGYAPTDEHPETVVASRLVGPFSLHPTGVDGFQVRNGDGTCCVFVRGERVAKQVVALFNHVAGRGGF